MHSQKFTIELKHTILFDRVSGVSSDLSGDLGDLAFA